MRETAPEANPDLGKADARPPEKLPAAPAGSGRRQIALWLIPSVGTMLFGGVLLGVVLLGQGQLLSGDGDTALHLRLGQDMLTHGGLLTANTLTSAEYGQPFIAWEWLSEIIFAGIWRLAGLNGLVALVGLIVAATSVWLFRAVRRRGTPLFLAMPLTLAAIALTSIHWLARPHIFSLLLTLWWSEQLWVYWQSNNPRKLWPFPFVLAVWANLHSGYIAGLIILGTATALVWFFPKAASVRDVTVRRWHLIRALAACILATLLTPWGLNGLLHLFAFFSNGAVLGQVQEWASPDFHTGYGKLFLALLLLFGACGVFRGWLAGGRSARPADLEPGNEQRLAQLAVREPGALGYALVGVFTALALVSVRALPLWALVVTPILGRELTCWVAEWGASGMSGHLSRFCRAVFLRSWLLESVERRLRSGFWGIMVVAFVLTLVLNGGALPGTRVTLLQAQFSSRLFPVEAVQAIQRGAIPGGALPGGAGFTTLEWADYVEWTLPHQVVMVDSRIDSFDANVLHDYQSLLTAQPSWNQLLARYQIRWVLVPTTIPLAQIISLAQGWLCQEADSQHLAVLCVPAPTVPVT